MKGGMHVSVRKSSNAVKKAVNSTDDEQRNPIMNLGNLTQHGAPPGFPTMVQFQKMMQFQIQQMISQQMTTMFGAMQNGMHAGGPGMSGGALGSSMPERSRQALTNGSRAADSPDTQGTLTDCPDTPTDTQQTDAPDQPGFARPTTAQAQVRAMAEAMAAAKGNAALKRPAAAAKAKTAAKSKTKPAAKAVAKTAAKAKAKAKASTTKGKTKKKEVPGWTMQQRIKSYPDG